LTDQVLQTPLVAKEAAAVAVKSDGARNFSFQVAATLVTRIIMGLNSVVTGVLVARWLGAKELGALAVLNISIAYAVQIGSLGLASANTYFIARDRRRLSTVATNSLVFCFCAGAILALAVVWFARSSPQLFADLPLSLVAIAAAAVPFQLLSLMGLNVFLAVGLIGRSNLLDLLGQSAIVVNAVLVLVLLHRGLPELITLNAAATIAVSLVIVVLVARYISRRTEAGRWQPDASLLRQMMQYGLKIHLQTIASLFLFRVDLLIVKYFRGSTEAGVYSVASQMALLLMLLPGVISTLLFPRIAAEQDQGGALACKVTRHATLVMFVICLLAIPAIYLLPLLYGPAFSAAIEQALILLPGVFLISIAGVLAQHFSGTGLPLPLPLFWIAALVLNTVANFLIVPVHGARGAAIMSSISYALVFALISFYFHIRTGNRLRDDYVIRGPELRALLNPRRLFTGT